MSVQRSPVGSWLQCYHQELSADVHVHDKYCLSTFQDQLPDHTLYWISNTLPNVGGSVHTIFSIGDILLTSCRSGLCVCVCFSLFAHKLQLLALKVTFHHCIHQPRYTFIFLSTTHNSCCQLADMARGAVSTAAGTVKRPYACCKVTLRKH